MGIDLGKFSINPCAEFTTHDLSKFSIIPCDDFTTQPSQEWIEEETRNEWISGLQIFIDEFDTAEVVGRKVEAAIAPFKGHNRNNANT